LRKVLLIYLVLFVLSVFLMVSGTKISAVTELPWRVTSRLSTLLLEVKEGGKTAVKSVVEATKIMEENLELKKENLKLKEKLKELSFVERENKRLKNLLKIRDYLKRRVLFAKVVSWVGDYWELDFILDKGREDGVVEGMAVVGAKGIVGIVVKVDRHVSRAISNLDPKFSIHVEDYRSKVRGILCGDGAFLRLKYILPSMDVKPGDILVSTGVGGIFPGGIVVARVVRVSKSIESHFLDIIAEPTDRLENNTFVLLVGGVRVEGKRKD